MALYTLILDWDGGTYVHQTRGQSVHRAVGRWAEQLDVGLIPGMDVAAREQLVSAIREDDAVALDGLTNVWCCSALLHGKLALVHAVRTDADS